MSESYVPRIVDAAVRDYLEAFPAVCIEGPKWCGKTTTASQHAASQFSLADPKMQLLVAAVAHRSGSFLLGAGGFFSAQPAFSCARSICSRTERRG